MTVGITRPLYNIWWLVLLQGIASLILGLMLFIVPAITLPALVVFLGAYWLVMGIFSIIGIFIGYSRAHWGWALFSGILGIIAGILVLSSPLLAAILLPAILAVIIAIQGILIGIVSLIHGFKGSGGGAIAIGIVSMAFGAVLLIWPLYAGFTMVIVIAVFAILGGIAAIVNSFQIRNAEKKAAIV